MTRWTNRVAVLVAASAGISLAMPVGADTLTQFMQKSTVNGDLRVYDFSRDYSGPAADQSAFAIGGKLNLATAPFWGGFGAGVTFFYAGSPGLESSNRAHVDGTLAGYSSLTALGQAYVQYQNHAGLVRAGDQIINNPWVGDSDGRMIPATYQGVSGTLTPLPGLALSAFRVYRYKNRTDTLYSRSNLYFNTVVGGAGFLPATTPDGGVAAAGLSYKGNGWQTQGWYYKFYDFAAMGYLDAHYAFGNGSVKPFIGAQGVREVSGGVSALGNVDATAYGAQAGIAASQSLWALSYDDIPAHTGAFANGDIVSPYTYSYATDPLYTTSMIQGVIDRKTTGHAVKASVTYFAFQRTVRWIASYARYSNAVYAGYSAPTTDETDLDATYFLGGDWKGLSLRDRLGIAHHFPTLNTFVYNRVMLEYDF